MNGDVFVHNIVSIIIPVYNTQAYLEKCIQSVVNQTYKDLEIILVDDGSTDSSLEICKKWKEIDSRVIVLHKENGGQGSARNMALDIASGNYIGFVDSDDWIESNMYENLLSNLLTYDADISCCKGTTVHDLDNTIKVYRQPEIMLAHQMLEIKQSPCDKLYRSELFSNIRFPESRAYEDCATIYKLLDKAHVVVDQKSAYYHYEIRNNSTMTKNFDERKMYLITAYKDMYDFYKKNYPQYADLVKIKLAGAIQYCAGEAINITEPLTGRTLYQDYAKDINKLVRTVSTKGLPIKSKILLRMICFFPNVYGMLYKSMK